MSEKSSVEQGGFDLAQTLFTVFLVLKLTDLITWSWWWVTAPIWIPLGLVVIALGGWAAAIRLGGK